MEAESHLIPKPCTNHAKVIRDGGTLWLGLRVECGPVRMRMRCDVSNPNGRSFVVFAALWVGVMKGGKEKYIWRS